MKMSGDDRSAADPRDVPLRWRLMLRLLSRLPQGALSRMTGRVADVRIPRALRSPVLGAFARAAGIDTSEIEHPVDAYATLDAFFVRRLKPGARRWPVDTNDFTSPVDGIVGELGTISGGRLLQAKGRDYSAAGILDDAAAAEPFEGGVFITIYLSPRHYHRIHSPVAGRIRSARHIPGALLPVNPPAIASIDELFPRNERLIADVASRAGSVAVIAVGAFNVGRITASFDSSLVTNVASRRTVQRSYDEGIEVGRGEEIMAFHLGSTVVLLFERDHAFLHPDMVAGREIRLGETIANPAR
jgi:phosphatidylserine decarboxylase